MPSMSKIPQPLSRGEEEFALHLRAHGIEYEREFIFHPKRKWRADFYIPAAALLVEIEGGVWSGGRHTRGKGFSADLEKYNAAILMGYRLLRYTPEMVTLGTAIKDVLEMMP